MPANRFEFHYRPADVADAQRTRFFKSGQFKVIVLLWALSMLFTAAPLVFPGVLPGISTAGWGLVFQVILLYGVVILVLGLLTPLFEYYLNRFWRMALVFQFNDKQLRLGIAGKPRGLHLKWRQIARADETHRTFILSYGAGGKFIVLPKSIFQGDPNALPRFTALLASRHAAPEGQELTGDEIEDEEAEEAGQ